jgi:phosphoribosyl-dephospho-CoA transferase
MCPKIPTPIKQSPNINTTGRVKLRLSKELTKQNKTIARHAERGSKTGGEYIKSKFMDISLALII